MRLAKWTRTDQVFLEGVLWALPGLALLPVVADGLRALRGQPLEVRGSLPDDLAPTTDPVLGPLTGTVVVQDPTATQYGWALMPSVLLLVLAVVAARLLLGVARSLRTGDPFSTQNASRLRVLGILLVLSGTSYPVFRSIGFEGVLDPLLSGPPRAWTLDLSLLPLLSATLVFFLAEVFARGARLREDVEGLV
ncbi:MAG: hypothetical protein AVDCRST_MAG36-3128 [uncultured Nocardioidaceae bacterium]|uniref:DUF2975 domain-containing protein n=1 Tax=uncultured Nocardioidaceae bacterium TaxID=253824 RepID=A0A6J4MTY6_9ACTN|nr:MAG: hypothetical protein AVDCRST_MAG36-3128 [uncultured Nocardioidaceae bacterium]